MECWAKEHEDWELDMPVIVRVHTPEDCFVGDLFTAAVDPGCTEEDALVLEADQDYDDGEEEEIPAAPAIEELDLESDPIAALEASAAEKWALRISGRLNNAELADLVNTLDSDPRNTVLEALLEIDQERNPHLYTKGML
jgi:hypothetical protein